MTEYNRGLKTAHEVDKHGHLSYLITAFLGAYNRRTDAMLRIAQNDPAKIAAMIDRLDKAGTQLDTAVKANQPKVKGE